MEHITDHAGEIVGRPYSTVALDAFDWSGFWPVIDRNGKVCGISESEDDRLTVKVIDHGDGTIEVWPVDPADSGFDAYFITDTVPLQLWASTGEHVTIDTAA